jgi:tetratricopeptide (TPR) repeat protein
MYDHADRRYPSGGRSTPISGRTAEQTNAVLQRARELIGAHRYDEAFRELQGHVARGADDRDTNYLLGNVAYRRKQDDLALDAFRRSLRADPRYGPALYGLGITLRRLGRERDGRLALEEAVKADPALSGAVHKHLATTPAAPTVPAQPATTHQAAGAAGATAAATNDATSHRPTLPGPVVIGRASNIQVRRELADGNWVVAMFTGNPVRRDEISVVTMRLTRDDGPPAAVEMRGTLDGSLPQDGDRVAVPERWENRGLRVDRLQNLETGEILTAAGRSAAAKTAIRAGKFVYVALLIGIVGFLVLTFSHVFADGDGGTGASGGGGAGISESIGGGDPGGSGIGGDPGGSGSGGDPGGGPAPGPALDEDPGDGGSTGHTGGEPAPGAAPDEDPGDGGSTGDTGGGPAPGPLADGDTGGRSN